MVERIRTLLESRQLTPTQFADAIGVARPIVSHILSGRNKPSLEVVQRILAAMPDLAMPWLLNGTGPMLAGTSAVAAPSLPLGAVAVPPVAAVPAPALVVNTIDERVEAVIEGLQAPAPGIEHTEQEVVSAAIPTVVQPRVSTPAPGRNQVAPKRFVANTAPLDALPSTPTIIPVQPLAVETERPLTVAPIRDAVPGLPVSPPPSEIPATAATLPPGPATNDTPGAALASALFAGGDKPIRRIVIFYRDGSFADYQPE